jgi:hypothetical protein
MINGSKKHLGPVRTFEVLVLATMGSVMAFRWNSWL